MGGLSLIPQQDVYHTDGLGTRLGEVEVKLETRIYAYMDHAQFSCKTISPISNYPSSHIHTQIHTHPAAKEAVEQWKKMGNKTRQQCTHMYIHAAQQWKFCGATLFLAEVRA